MTNTARHADAGAIGEVEALCAELVEMRDTIGLYRHTIAEAARYIAAGLADPGGPSPRLNRISVAVWTTRSRPGDLSPGRAEPPVWTRTQSCSSHPPPPAPPRWSRPNAPKPSARPAPSASAASTLSTRQDYGVWGGTDEDERRNLRRAGARAARFRGAANAAAKWPEGNNVAIL